MSIFQNIFQSTLFNGNVQITNSNQLVLSDNAIVHASNSAPDASLDIISGLRDAISDQTAVKNELKVFQISTMYQNNLKSFTDIDLSNGTSNVTNAASLTNMTITDANFSNSNFTNVNLTGVQADNVNFTGTVMTNANLTNAKMSSSNFTNANLTGVTLTGIDLFGANLTNATIIVPETAKANVLSVTGKSVNISNTPTNAFGNFSPALANFGLLLSVSTIEVSADGTVILFLLLNSTNSSYRIVRRVFIDNQWNETHFLDMGTSSFISSIALSASGLVFAISSTHLQSNNNQVLIYRLSSLISNSVDNHALTVDTSDNKLALNEDGSRLVVSEPLQNSYSGEISTFSFIDNLSGYTNLNIPIIVNSNKVMLKTINGQLKLFAAIYTADDLRAYDLISGVWTAAGTQTSGGANFDVASNGNVIVTQRFTSPTRLVVSHIPASSNNVNQFSSAMNSFNIPFTATVKLIGNGNFVAIIIPFGTVGAGLHIRPFLSSAEFMSSSSGNLQLNQGVPSFLAFDNVIHNYGSIAAVSELSNKIIVSSLGNNEIKVIELYSYIS